MKYFCLDSFTLHNYFEIIQLYSFSLLSSIPLYGYTINSILGIFHLGHCSFYP